MTRIGVISDTHGLLRDSALAHLVGSELILHAGDIGRQSVITALEKIAPVYAVRGNVDRDPWATAYPEQRTIKAAGLRIHLLHDLHALSVPASQFDIVVSGHSHIPRNECRAGVRYFNPGSAGPRRFRLPISVGLLKIDSNGISTQLHTLEA